MFLIGKVVQAPVGIGNRKPEVEMVAIVEALSAKHNSRQAKIFIEPVTEDIANVVIEFQDFCSIDVTVSETIMAENVIDFLQNFRFRDVCSGEESLDLTSDNLAELETHLQDIFPKIVYKL